VGGYGAEVARVAVRRSYPPTFQIPKFGAGEKRNPLDEYSVFIHPTASLCRATRCSVEHYAADWGYPPNIRRHHGPRSGAVCGSGGVSSVALLGSPDRLGGRLGVSWSLQGGDAFEGRGQLSAALGVGLALGLELLPERLYAGAWTAANALAGFCSCSTRSLERARSVACVVKGPSTWCLP
jgi:hypothetical protein